MYIYIYVFIYLFIVDLPIKELIFHNYSDEHTLRRYFFSKISILTLRTLCLRIFPTLRTLHLEHMIKNPPNVLSVGPVQPNDDTYIYI